LILLVFLFTSLDTSTNTGESSHPYCSLCCACCQHLGPFRAVSCGASAPALHCAAMSTPDPFGLEPASDCQLPSNAAQQVERALFDRAIGVTVSIDVLTRDGPVTLDRQLPADVKAATAFLAAHKPSMYGQAVTPMSVQFVALLPSQPATVQDWLAMVAAYRAGTPSAALPLAGRTATEPEARRRVEATPTRGTTSASLPQNIEKNAIPALIDAVQQFVIGD